MRRALRLRQKNNRLYCGLAVKAIRVYANCFDGLFAELMNKSKTQFCFELLLLLKKYRFKQRYFLVINIFVKERNVSEDQM